MKLQVTTTEKKEIEVPVPSFWASEDKQACTAILDENTIVKASRGIHFSSIANGTKAICGGDIEFAILFQQPCTEETFFEVYNSILQSISLTPVLAS